MTDAISRSAVIKMLEDWPSRLGIIDHNASVLFAERLGCLEALAAIRHEIDRFPALDVIPHTCATCEHAFYRTIAEGERCKTISVFCKEKECHNADKWKMCNERMDGEADDD